MRKNIPQQFNDSFIIYEDYSQHDNNSLNTFDKQIKLLDLPLQEWAAYKTNISSASKSSFNQYIVVETPMNFQVNDNSFFQQFSQSTQKKSYINIDWKNQQKEQDFPIEINESNLQRKKIMIKNKQTIIQGGQQLLFYGSQIQQIQQIQKAGQIQEKFQFYQSIKQQTQIIRCKCKKSKCLKQYCECFRVNKTCKGCNCFNCHNIEEFKQQRNLAISMLIAKNPQAFKPKLIDEKHIRGCHCKRSSCKKNYCQCYQAGLYCGINCKCIDCKNNQQFKNLNKQQTMKKKKTKKNRIKKMKLQGR